MRLKVVWRNTIGRNEKQRGRVSDVGRSANESAGFAVIGLSTAFSPAAENR